LIKVCKTFMRRFDPGPRLHTFPVKSTFSATWQVRWLNNKQPISRRQARVALISRMKVLGTSADASDLVDDIKDCLMLAAQGHAPTFQTDLQARLIEEVLRELHEGRIEDFGFERLIQAVLQGLGASEVRLIPRNQDKGADLLATFLVAGAFQQVIAVQAKHWKPHPPVGPEVVEQLIRGIEAEGANLGMVVTSGSISGEAAEAATKYFDETGIKIEMVDGEQFAKLIVEHGTPAF
jgi:restriction endonuclease Mrr